MVVWSAQPMMETKGTWHIVPFVIFGFRARLIMSVQIGAARKPVIKFRYRRLSHRHGMVNLFHLGDNGHNP